MLLVKDVIEHHGVVLKSEVAHESERALCKCDHWRDVVTIELLGCPQDSAISSKRDDVRNLPFAALF